MRDSPGCLQGHGYRCILATKEAMYVLRPLWFALRPRSPTVGELEVELSPCTFLTWYDPSDNRPFIDIVAECKSETVTNVEGGTR